MPKNPAISVVMSAYNAEKDIGEAIESILSQTFEDFELIVIDDGSKDGTLNILNEYAQKDPRVKVHPQANTGLTKALNKGLALCQGRYIARQDCDDFSHPERFQAQFDFLESHPGIALVGGNADDEYPDGFKAQWGSYEEDELQKVVYLKTPFPHSTIMMRADVCQKLGGYDESFKTSQDMEMWMRFAKHGPIAMIKEPMIRRGVGEDTISVQRRWRQSYDGLRARWRHNSGFRRLFAVYYTARNLLIGLLPDFIVKGWRSRKAK